jgi:hypothetical protein
MNATLRKLVRRDGDTGAAAPEPAYRPGKHVLWAAAALIGAMLADLAETVLDPASSGEAADVYTAAATQHARLVLCAYLLLVSALLVFPGVYGLARGVVGRGRRFASVAVVVSFLGAVGHAALGAAYLIWAAIPGGGAGEQGMVAVIDRIMSSAAVAPLGIGFIAFPVGMLALFGALLRARVAPRWVLWPVLAAPVAAGFTPGPVYLATAVALVLLLVAAVAATVRLARGTAAPASADRAATRPAAITAAAGEAMS